MENSYWKIENKKGNKSYKRILTTKIVLQQITFKTLRYKEKMLVTVYQPITTQYRILTHYRYVDLAAENILRKGEIACNNSKHLQTTI